MVPKIYNAAIIGCGRIGSSFDDPLQQGIGTHAGAYVAHSATRLVAAADIDRSALDRFHDRWKVDHLYDSYIEMLREQTIDIVSICTPAETHVEVIRDVLNSRVPAIWCEKPLTVRIEDGQELLQQSTGRVMAVNHIRRWDQAYGSARTWIDAGGLGSLRGAVAWYTKGIMNIGTHMFDVLRYLLGDPNWAWAPASSPGHEGRGIPDINLSCTLGFPGGAICQVIGCGADDLLLFELDIVGEKGRLKIAHNGERVEVWENARSSRFAQYREPSEPRSLHEGTDRFRMLSALSDIVTCLETGREPRCTVKDGLKAVEIAAAAVLASKKGSIVKLPLC